MSRPLRSAAVPGWGVASASIGSRALSSSVCGPRESKRTRTRRAAWCTVEGSAYCPSRGCSPKWVRGASELLPYAGFALDSLDLLGEVAAERLTARPGSSQGQDRRPARVLQCHGERRVERECAEDEADEAGEVLPGAARAELVDPCRREPNRGRCQQSGRHELATHSSGGRHEHRGAREKQKQAQRIARRARRRRELSHSDR